jgi:hypothetical protein
MPMPMPVSVMVMAARGSAVTVAVTVPPAAVNWIALRTSCSTAWARRVQVGAGRGWVAGVHGDGHVSAGSELPARGLGGLGDRGQVDGGEVQRGRFVGWSGAGEQVIDHGDQTLPVAGDRLDEPAVGREVVWSARTSR